MIKFSVYMLTKKLKLSEIYYGEYTGIRFYVWFHTMSNNSFAMKYICTLSVHELFKFNNSLCVLYALCKTGLRFFPAFKWCSKNFGLCVKFCRLLISQSFLDS